MDITDQTVQKIQKFAEKRQEAEQESVKEPLTGTALHVYTRRLDATLQGLQEQVKRQQDELNKACVTHYSKIPWLTRVIATGAQFP